MVKSHSDPQKKFKGKKKYTNILEKKAKGVKLNQTDRKRIVSVEKKKALREEVKRSVKSELAQIQAQQQNDEDTRDSLCSESSFGSQPAKTQVKKRVSFAKTGRLETTRVFHKGEDNLKVKPSEASPGKGILRSKGVKDGKKISVKSAIGIAHPPAGALSPKEKKNSKLDKKNKVKKNDVSNKENAYETKEEKNGDESMDVSESPASGEAADSATKKKSIKVTRKQKEEIMAMPRKERKAYLKQLKAEKSPLGDKGQKCIALWEIIRSRKTPLAEKDDSITKLVGLVKGYASKLIYAHDTCRVIECLISLQREGIKNLLFEELTPEIVRMTKSKYSHFYVAKMLKIGSKQQREIIINAFRGHAVSLMRISYASDVLERAYNDYANAQQRFDIVSEFYGKEFVMFRSDKPRSLDQIIAEEPAKKTLILQHLEEQLLALVEKTTIRHSLSHRLLLDFASHCSTEQLTNLIDSIKDRIPQIIHSAEGAHVAMKCIWNASPKDRKLIVKNFKELSVKAAEEHYGHRVLLAIFDSIDDTVLVNKYIVSELGNEVGKLVMHPWGEKVIHYLVHPRDNRAMDGNEIKLLKEGDNNPQSKKEKKDRYPSLYAGISEALYTYVNANIEALIFDNIKYKFLVCCYEPTSQYDLFDRKIPTEYVQRYHEELIKLAKEEFIPMDDKRYHLIEHPAGNFVLLGAFRLDRTLPEEERLAVKMAKTIPPKKLASWISCNKGCIILKCLLEHGSAETRAIVAGAINMKQLKQYTTAGSEQLRQELAKH